MESERKLHIRKIEKCKTGCQTIHYRYVDSIGRGSFKTEEPTSYQLNDPCVAVDLEDQQVDGADTEIRISNRQHTTTLRQKTVHPLITVEIVRNPVTERHGPGGK